MRWYVGEPKIVLDQAKATRPTMPLHLLVRDAATTKISFAISVACRTSVYRCPNIGYKAQGFIIGEDVSDDSEEWRSPASLASRSIM